MCLKASPLNITFFSFQLALLLFVSACSNNKNEKRSLGTNDKTRQKTQNSSRPRESKWKLSEVIDSHLNAVGGREAIKKIVSIERRSNVVSTTIAGSSTGTLVEKFELVADLGRVDLKLSSFQESKGWKQQKGWKKNSFEALRDLTPEELPLEKAQAPVSLVFRLKELFGTEAFLPPTSGKFNNQDCIKLKIADSPLEIYLNQSTMLIEGIVAPPTMQVTFSNYRKTSGVHLPFKSRVEKPSTNMTIICNVNEIEVNAKIDPSVSTKPAN